MKLLRAEIISTTLIASLMTALALSIPVASIGFAAEDVPTTRVASSAFVSLSPEEEAAALKAAKTAWQPDAAAGRRRLEVQLPLGELPDESEMPLPNSASGFDSLRESPAVPYMPSAWLPTCAAPAIKLPPETPEASRPVFSREELLDLK